MKSNTLGITDQFSTMKSLAKSIDFRSNTNVESEPKIFL